MLYILCFLKFMTISLLLFFPFNDFCLLKNDIFTITSFPPILTIAYKLNHSLVVLNLHGNTRSITITLTKKAATRMMVAINPLISLIAGVAIVIAVNLFVFPSSLRWMFSRISQATTFNQHWAIWKLKITQCSRIDCVPRWFALLIELFLSDFYTCIPQSIIHLET